jgi:hypothetical protein
MKISFVRLLFTACACAALTACIGSSGSSGSSTTTTQGDSTSTSSTTQSATGLPAYPNATDTGTLPRMSRNGNAYSSDSMTSTDNLSDVESWYRQQLSGATETAKDDAYMTGIVLTMPNKDEVDVYNDKTGDASLVTIKLLKYIGAGD